MINLYSETRRLDTRINSWSKMLRGGASCPLPPPVGRCIYHTYSIASMFYYIFNTNLGHWQYFQCLYLSIYIYIHIMYICVCVIYKPYHLLFQIILSSSLISNNLLNTFKNYFWKVFSYMYNVYVYVYVSSCLHDPKRHMCQRKNVTNIEKLV